MLKPSENCMAKVKLTFRGETITGCRDSGWDKIGENQEERFSRAADYLARLGSQKIKRGVVACATLL